MKDCRLEKCHRVVTREFRPIQCEGEGLLRGVRNQQIKARARLGTNFPRTIGLEAESGCWTDVPKEP